MAKRDESAEVILERIRSLPQTEQVLEHSRGTRMSDAERARYGEVDSWTPILEQLRRIRSQETGGRRGEPRES